MIWDITEPLPVPGVVYCIFFLLPFLSYKRTSVGKVDKTNPIFTRDLMVTLFWANPPIRAIFFLLFNVQVSFRSIPAKIGTKKKMPGRGKQCL